MTQDFSWAEIGSRIRDRRVQQRWSQRELAQRAGITQAGLARLESGQTNPQLETLRRLSEALNIPVRQLFVDEVVVATEAAHPIMHRIARVLESGDLEAIRTVENAVDTAEILLRRGGRFVRADESARNEAQDESTARVRMIEQMTGWKMDQVKADQSRSTAQKQFVMSAISRPTAPPIKTRGAKRAHKSPSTN